MTDDLVDRLLEVVRGHAVWIPDPPRLFTHARDPKDEQYINLAIAAEADFLVTRDKDILSLAETVEGRGERLRELSPGLRIVSPAVFLRQIPGKA